MDPNEEEYLCKLYKLGATPVDMYQLGDACGLGKNNTESSVRKLMKKRLIQHFVSEGKLLHISITTNGIRKAKELIGEE